MSHKIVNTYILEELQIHSKTQNTKTDLHLMLVYWSQSPTFWLMGEVHYVVARWSANTNLGIGKHKYTIKYLQIHKETHKYNAYYRFQRVNALSGRNLKQYFDDCRSLFSWEIEKRTKKIKCLFDRLYSWVKFVSVWVALGKRSPKPKLTPKSCFLRRLFLFVWPKRAKVDVVQLSEWVSVGGLATAICQDWPEKCDEKETTEVLGLFVNVR